VPTKVEDIAKNLKSNQEKIDKFFSKIDSKNIYNISFEEFSSSPTEELIKVGKFLKLDFTNVLSNFNNKIYFDEPEITLKWKEKTKGLIDNTRINSYINHPQREEIEKYL
jgi:hypothetical protein